MRGTPGLDLRIHAMYVETFLPGSCPPSPGLAPWAILISSWSALTRKCGVTPKRPDATCLILDVATSPFRSPLRCGSCWERPSPSTSDSTSHRTGSSPPSPELDLPPMRFMATAIVSCVSREMAPSDMPPVQNRRMMSSTGSTSSTGTGFRSDLNSSMSRSTWAGEFLKWSM